MILRPYYVAGDAFRIYILTFAVSSTKIPLSRIGPRARYALVLPCDDAGVIIRKSGDFGCLKACLKNSKRYSNGSRAEGY
jgi:hypothetical protein